MSRRCKPGMRARIIGGRNAGKVVVVVSRYYYPDDVDGGIWPEALLPWVITSVGAPLRSICLDTKQENPPRMTMVEDDRNLEPLRDDDDGLDTDQKIDKGLDRLPVAPRGVAT